MLTKIALSSVLVLGAASMAMADVAESKEGDIYPVVSHSVQAKGFNAFASTRGSRRIVVDQTDFDRHGNKGH